MNGFLREQFAAKRARPGDNLMSVLLSEELDGVPLSEPRLLTYCHQVLSVGNDTTRSLLAGFAIAFDPAVFPHPQRFSIRRDQDQQHQLGAHLQPREQRDARAGGCLGPGHPGQDPLAW